LSILCIPNVTRIERGFSHAHAHARAIGLITRPVVQCVSIFVDSTFLM